jgi:sugar/nucleoside kinase (ribokinase family)
MVDIFSPNHIEVAQIFGKPSPEISDRGILERYASFFVESGLGPFNSGAVVIRAGEEGCLVVSSTQSVQWLPSYYPRLDKVHPSKVVDPTGAGNAFLGAFAIGYLDTDDLVQAACYGNVGASFALEQIGVPTLEVLRAGKELWNGSDVYARLRCYRARLR